MAQPPGGRASPRPGPPAVAATTAELAARIRTDLPNLRPATEVLRIDLSAADQHDRGRGVARLRLSDGTSVFLKPRSDGCTACWPGAGGGRQRGRAPRAPAADSARARWVRPRGGGRAPDCGDEAAVIAYFHRAGALLRVLQALGATDLHHENFVPADGPADRPGDGRGPGPLRSARAGQGLPPDPVLAARLPDTPARPAWSPVSSGRPAARGRHRGPGRSGDRADAVRGPDLVPGPEGPRRQRTPLANGAALPTRGGRRSPCTGTSRTCSTGSRRPSDRWSRCRREAADEQRTDPGGPVRARPTRTYARLLQQSLAPDALTDGVERELVLHRLYRADDAPAGLVACEIEALRELDIPLFTVPFDSEDLVSERGSVLAACCRSPRRTGPGKAGGGRRPDRPPRRPPATVFSLAPTAEPARSVHARRPAGRRLGRRRPGRRTAPAAARLRRGAARRLGDLNWAGARPEPQPLDLRRGRSRAVRASLSRSRARRAEPRTGGAGRHGRRRQAALLGAVERGAVAGPGRVTPSAVPPGSSTPQPPARCCSAIRT